MKPLLLLTLLLSSSSLFAAVKLPSIFTDHMVLQRDKAVPVWGKAAPGEEVVVEFAGQKKTTKAGAGGQWMVKLDPMPATDQPRDLVISSNHQSQIVNHKCTDVLIGEVWLASGQSNMEWEMQMKPDSQADIPNTTHPNLRLIEVPKTTALTPQDDVPAKWARSAPESAPPAIMRMDIQGMRFSWSMP